MGNIFNIEEYCKDTKSTLSMQDVEINDYNKDYVAEFNLQMQQNSD